MPTYEYGCDDCGNEFEVYQSITASPLSNCPSCNGNGVQRLISGGGGLLFKGSGFYATDHRSPSGQTSSKSHNDETKTSSESKESSKSESVSTTSTKTEGA